MNFKVGQRVKYSGYALRPQRDYWQGQGREPAKSRAKRAFETKRAMRGTVTEVHPPKRFKLGGVGPTITVTTDDGAVHHSLPYLWEEAAP